MIRRLSPEQQKFANMKYGENNSSAKAYLAHTGGACVYAAFGPGEQI